MNSTLIKIAIAYIAGIVTYQVFQNYNIAKKIDNITPHKMSLSTGDTRTGDMGDTTATDNISTARMSLEAAGAPSGDVQCPCDNEARYDVSPIEPSMNVPITTVPTCSTMVANANPHTGTVVGKGAWFSKITIDNMFCHKPDANGIYVYKALNTDGTPTYIVEAARSNKISSDDDGTSFIYYSRAMCPNICGQCGQ